MVYNLNMFRKIIFVVTVNYDIVGIQATGSLGKCGRAVFEIISPTDNFETIKKWDFPCCQQPVAHSWSKELIVIVDESKDKGIIWLLDNWLTHTYQVSQICRVSLDLSNHLPASRFQCVFSRLALKHYSFFCLCLSGYGVSATCHFQQRSLVFSLI